MYSVTPFDAPIPASSVSEEDITVIRQNFGSSYNSISDLCTPPRQTPGNHFSHPKKFKVSAPVREYYSYPALSGNVIRTPEIRFQILTAHFKTHTGLTLDAPAHAASVARDATGDYFRYSGASEFSSNEGGIRII
ncbi:hypothetical protein TNCV_2185161 [Trichonephila clavipes]|nr:hypothetical protein TNCV_2185161 [Trichonephila clavipes]